MKIQRATVSAAVASEQTWTVCYCMSSNKVYKKIYSLICLMFQQHSLFLFIKCLTRGHFSQPLIKWASWVSDKLNNEIRNKENNGGGGDEELSPHMRTIWNGTWLWESRPLSYRKMHLHFSLLSSIHFDPPLLKTRLTPVEVDLILF